MKKLFLILLCLGLAIVSAGCQNAQTRAGEGTLIGGVIGAAAGGIIGHQSGHGVEGAVIGGVAGAVTGAIAGSQIEKPVAEQETAASQMQPVTTATPATTTNLVNPNQISIQQIIELTKEGIDENVIIDKIRLTNSKFNLSQDDIAYLRQEGVSEAVIAVMQAG